MRRGWSIRHVSFSWMLASLVCYLDAHGTPSSSCTELDVTLLVDTTWSMSLYMADLRKSLIAFVDDVRTAFPGTQVAVATFNDKPLSCRHSGYLDFGNYCARIDQPLTSADVQPWLRHLPSRFGSGNDHTEDALGGLLVAASQVAWRPLHTHVTRARYVVVITDARYHVANDFIHCADTIRPNNGDAMYDCAHEDYPTVEQVRSMLDRSHVIPVFLTFRKIETMYQTLLRDLAKDNEGWVRSLEDGSTTLKSLYASVFAQAFKERGYVPCSTNEEHTTTTLPVLTTTSKYSGCPEPPGTLPPGPLPSCDSGQPFLRPGEACGLPTNTTIVGPGTELPTCTVGVAMVVAATPFRL